MRLSIEWSTDGILVDISTNTEVEICFNDGKSTRVYCGSSNKLINSRFTFRMQHQLEYDLVAGTSQIHRKSRDTP